LDVISLNKTRSKREKTRQKKPTIKDGTQANNRNR